MPEKSLSASKTSANSSSRVADAVYKIISNIPVSSEKKSSDPRRKSRKLAGKACRRAAGISTTLSLPPGPLGMLTVVPDLVSIWKIQGRLIADIAASHGRTNALTRESMIYCLFRHRGASVVRDLVVRVGDRALIRRASVQVLQKLLAKIGMRITRKVIGRTLSRWIPVLGALGVGAYAYYDTGEVAKNAIELFSREVDVEPEK